ncbi:MAG: short-chain dehydrogenase, partial [Pseudomonadota bacterium]
MSSTVFITGANRGIGLSLTKLYLDNGWQVHATTRNLA